MERKGYFAGSLLVASMLFFAHAAHANMVTYDSWTTNENGSGNYIFEIDDNDAGRFNYSLTVDPWNAEALGLFMDFGSMSADGSAASLTGSDVVLYGRNQSNGSCGSGCNINGLSIPGFDGIWSLVFRLGTQGFDEIQTFSWSTSDFGLSLDDIGVVAIRAQPLCPEGGTLDEGDSNCGGSDKSYGYATPPTVRVTEPGTLALLGLGLLAMGVRWRMRF